MSESSQPKNWTMGTLTITAGAPAAHPPALPPSKPPPRLPVDDGRHLAGRLREPHGHPRRRALGGGHLRRGRHQHRHDDRYILRCPDDDLIHPTTRKNTWPTPPATARSLSPLATRPTASASRDRSPTARTSSPAGAPPRTRRARAGSSAPPSRWASPTSLRWAALPPWRS